MLKILEIDNLEPVYDYHMRFHSPHFFMQPFAVWKESFVSDVDGEGRVLFKKLVAKAAYDDDKMPMPGSYAFMRFLGNLQRWGWCDIIIKN